MTRSSTRHAGRVTRELKRALKTFFPILLIYIAAAYLLLPSIWRHYEHQKKRDGLPMVTTTAQGIQADPINLGIGPTLLGRNGEDDRYYTDGEVWVLRLVEDCATRTKPPEILPNPPVIALKDAIWKNIGVLYQAVQR